MVPVTPLSLLNFIIEYFLQTCSQLLLGHRLGPPLYSDSISGVRVARLRSLHQCWGLLIKNLKCFVFHRECLLHFLDHGGLLRLEVLDCALRPFAQFLIGQCHTQIRYRGALVVHHLIELLPLPCVVLLIERCRCFGCLLLRFGHFLPEE